MPPGIADPGANPFRPWSPYEVEQRKLDVMKDYHAGRMNAGGSFNAWKSALHGAPEQVRLGLRGDLIDSAIVDNEPYWKDSLQGEFNLWGMDRIIEKNTQGNRARPLGNPVGVDTYQGTRIVTKDVLDSAIVSGQGGGVLVRTDLVPDIYLWLNTRFPALERIERIPSNGLNHTWNNEIDFGDASDDFLDEFGAPSLSHGVYFQGQANIAILAIERGTSLKLEYATRQSGMVYNGNMGTGDLEMRNAVLSRAKILQSCFYRGTRIAGHTGTDEYGKSYVNGFDGLRVLLSTHANTAHSGFYPTGFGPVIAEVAGSGSILTQIDNVAGQVLDNGGLPTAVHLSTHAEQKLRLEGTNVVRYTMDDMTVGGGLVLGGRVRAVDTVAGLLPVIVVPGNGIGQYNIASGDGSVAFSNGTTVEDIYVLSEPYLQFAYLGAPDPVPMEIPLGLPGPDGRGALIRRFIIWWMIGLVMPVPIFQAKIRIAYP